MKLKKKILLLVTLIIFCTMFMSNVKAAFPDFIYDVTEFKITNTEISISGWGFIHNNNNDGSDSVSDSDSARNIEIIISAYDNANKLIAVSERIEPINNNGDSIYYLQCERGSPVGDLGRFCIQSIENATCEIKENGEKKDSTGTSCKYHDTNFIAKFYGNELNKIISNEGSVTFKIRAKYKVDRDGRQDTIFSDTDLETLVVHKNVITDGNGIIGKNKQFTAFKISDISTGESFSVKSSSAYWMNSEGTTISGGSCFNESEYQIKDVTAIKDTIYKNYLNSTEESYRRRKVNNMRLYGLETTSGIKYAFATWGKVTGTFSITFEHNLDTDDAYNKTNCILPISSNINCQVKNEQKSECDKHTFTAISNDVPNESTAYKTYRQAPACGNPKYYVYMETGLSFLATYTRNGPNYGSRGSMTNYDGGYFDFTVSYHSDFTITKLNSLGNPARSPVDVKYYYYLQYQNLDGGRCKTYWINLQDVGEEKNSTDDAILSELKASSTFGKNNNKSYLEAFDEEMKNVSQGNPSVITKFQNSNKKTRDINNTTSLSSAMKVKKCVQKSASVGSATSYTIDCDLVLKDAYMDNNGNANYEDGSLTNYNFQSTNRYYIPIGYNTQFKVFAEVTGVSIGNVSGLSITTGKHTYNCSIPIVNTFNEKIYRVVDLANMFPNMLPPDNKGYGLNWKNWILKSTTINGLGINNSDYNAGKLSNINEKLKQRFYGNDPTKLEYTVKLSKSSINTITNASNSLLTKDSNHYNSKDFNINKNGVSLFISNHPDIFERKNFHKSRVNEAGDGK